MINKDYFNDYNYSKHAKFCACVYVPLIAFDLTVSYLILKKYFNKHENK